MYSKASPIQLKMYEHSSGPPPPFPPFFQPVPPSQGHVLGEIVESGQEDSFLASPSTFPYSTQTSQQYRYPSQSSAQSNLPYAPRNSYQQELSPPGWHTPYVYSGTHVEPSYCGTAPSNLGNPQFMYSGQDVSQVRVDALSMVPPRAAPPPDSPRRYVAIQGGFMVDSNGAYLGDSRPVVTRQREGEYRSHSALVRDCIDRQHLRGGTVSLAQRLSMLIISFLSSNAQAFHPGVCMSLPVSKHCLRLQLHLSITSTSRISGS